MVSRGCKICGADPCEVVVPPPPAPFTVAKIGDALWFNIPSSLNWNWYSIDRDGWWCWEDLWHAGSPTLVSFDRSQFYWGCRGDFYVDECDRVWTDDELALLEPGNPSSAPQCHGCGSPHAWPHPKEIVRG